MNILFIGPYRQKDGWGYAALEYLKALHKTGHNITARPVYLGSHYGLEDDLLFELESNVSPNYDVVIQNVLPHLVDYNSNFGKNIGLFHIETGNLQYTSWPSRINNLDEVWVPSTVSSQHLTDSGVTVPIETVPIPVNTSKFEEQIQPLQIDYLKDKFVFYHIGSFIERKGWKELMAAFYAEFKPTDNVAMVFKSSVGGLNPTDGANYIQQQFHKLKEKLRIYINPEHYKQAVVITEHFTEEQLNSLHVACDAFVMPSYGESWCLPAIDAAGFGNYLVMSDGVGSIDYLGPANSLVESHKDMVESSDFPLGDLYTGRETWHRPNVLSLRQAMRDVYESFKLEPGPNELAIEAAFELSHDKIAEQMKEIL